MILPTSITPWYIWTALGVFGMFYAPYFIIYKQNKKFSRLANYLSGLLMFSLSCFMAANSLFEGLKFDDNIIFIKYNKNTNNIEDGVVAILLLQLVITMCVLCNELCILAETKKEKLKYIASTIVMFLVLLWAVFIRFFS